jgi:hypothetical protein
MQNLQCNCFRCFNYFTHFFDAKSDRQRNSLTSSKHFSNRCSIHTKKQVLPRLSQLKLMFIVCTFTMSFDFKFSVLCFPTRNMWNLQGFSANHNETRNDLNASSNMHENSDIFTFFSATMRRENYVTFFDARACGMKWIFRSDSLSMA